MNSTATEALPQCFSKTPQTGQRNDRPPGHVSLGSSIPMHGIRRGVLCLTVLLACLGRLPPSLATDQPNAGPQAQGPEQSQSTSTKPKPKSAELEEVLVTGTRLNLTPAEATEQIQIFTQEDIARSGQSTAADFLNTLPVTSLIVDPGSLQTAFASTGVRLRGLQLGATLVLIDGRRVAGSPAAAFDDIFDLNNVPLAAIDRIEIVAQGSSAVYGSDAIAGVVNIVLKRDFQGLTGAVKYGWADDTKAVNANLAWGQRWERGSFSVVASYLNQTELLGSDRALSADGDHTGYGSRDSRLPVGNPGNIYSVNGSNLPGVGAPYAAVPQGFTGPPTQAAYAATAGQLNKLSVFSDYGLIPDSHRTGLLASGTYEIGMSAQLFAQLLYSNVEQDQAVFPAGFLYGSPAFQEYTVSAANPFNPFGEKVGIGYVFPGASVLSYHTDFFMPTLGVRGELSPEWHWEIATWGSSEHERITQSSQANSAAVQAALNSSDPNTALNPFIAGAPGSPQLVNSVLYTDLQHYRTNSFSANALLRGSPLRLPSGPLQIAVGAEFNHTTLHVEDDSGQGNPIDLESPTVGRKTYASYAETMIPVLGPIGQQSEDLLDLTAAGRYDHYDDFGGKWTAEAGGALHPIAGLSLRAHWGQAFKAPSFYELYKVQNTFVAPIVDPLTGATTAVTVTSGGNPHLQPITGHSHSFDVVYTDAAVPGLEASLSNWGIYENNNIQALGAQIIVNNETDFPGAVVRAPSCTGGPPCPIVSVNNTFTNFGAIDVAGIDYLLRYRFLLVRVEWQPSISVTQTYHYTVAFRPGQPATERVIEANDDMNWAPRWKGTLGLKGHMAEWSGSVAARYVGSYRDYDLLVNGTYLTLGKLWYIDANLRHGLEGLGGAPASVRGLGLSIGGVNLFNRQPQFSNMFSGFYGFDILQADMRGRLLYVQLDGRW